MTLTSSDPTSLRNDHSDWLIDHLGLSNCFLLFLNHGATLIAKGLHVSFDFFDDAFTHIAIATQDAF